MSGSLRILASGSPPEKHDHMDIVLNTGKSLRLTDPRRFGAILWTEINLQQHKLLKNLGPEPLEKAFAGDYLFEISRKRKVAIKQFIMNSNIVVGVGNIYANEALFDAKINPQLSAGKLSRTQCAQLVKSTKKILRLAIKTGGTTIRNFVNGDGKPGYFIQRLKVYGRGKLPCKECKTSLKLLRMGQRATVYCPKCQK
jgi:formamidopyrimidine-DNA glycosylase